MLWDPPTNEEELEKPLEDGRKAWEEGRAFNFTIELLESTEFIGRIGIRQEAEDKVWNVGFWTHPKHQGEGYMSESVERIIEFGFSQLGALRIVACHALWNVASERVLKKAGMTFIRYIPEGYQKKGKWVEENLLGLSLDSWQKMRVEQYSEVGSRRL